MTPIPPHVHLSLAANSLYLASRNHRRNQESKKQEANAEPETATVEQSPVDTPSSLADKICSGVLFYLLGAIAGIVITFRGLFCGCFFHYFDFAIETEGKLLAGWFIGWAMVSALGLKYYFDALEYHCLCDPQPKTLELSESERRQKYNIGRVCGFIAGAVCLVMIISALSLIAGMRLSDHAKRYPPTTETRYLITYIVVALLQLKGLIRTPRRLRTVQAEWLEHRAENPELTFADFVNTPIAPENETEG